MTEPNQTAPHIVRKKQYQHFLILMMAIISIILIASLVIIHPTKIKHEHSNSVPFHPVVEEQDIYATALEQFQTQEDQNQKNIKSLQASIQQLQSDTAVKNKMGLLENKLEALQQTVQNQNVKANAFTENSIIKNVSAVDGNDQLQLSHTKKFSNHPLINPDTYVPAGTHVLGVLLQGAELSVKDSNEQNPKPVLIRLISPGDLPNHQKSHLQDCVITAAITGDLSSSRGDVRLERLSCVFPHRSIIDVAVEGTVSTHAKEGIDGEIYTRENSRLWDAALAGSLSGLSQGIASGYQKEQDNLLSTVKTVNPHELFQYGAAQGFSTGLNKLSDFEMNRADQIVPVISINGGKLVTVVFLKGFFFDEKNLNQTPDNNSDSQKNNQKNTDLAVDQLLQGNNDE